MIQLILLPIVTAGSVLGLVKGAAILVDRTSKVVELAERRYNALHTACPQRMKYVHDHCPTKDQLPALCYCPTQDAHLQFDHAYKYWFHNEREWLGGGKDEVLRNCVQHCQNKDRYALSVH